MVDGTNCTVNALTEQQVAHLALARIVTGAAASVACCITLLLIVFFRAFKARLQRFFFYFIVFLTINMLVTVLSVVDYRYITQNDLPCEIVAYLAQYTIHVVLILGIGTGYVFLKPQASPDNLEGQTRARLQEIVFVGLSVTTPATYNLIPFIHDAYGSSPTMPWWCWIIVEKDDCSTLVAGVYYMVILGGIPAFIVAVLSVGLIFNIAGKCRHTQPQARITLLLAICFIVFFLCYGLLTTVLIVYEVLLTTSTVRAFSISVTYGLHLTHTLVKPLFMVILQGVVYVYYFRKYRQDFRTAIRSWKDCCCRISSSHLQLPNIIEHTGQASFRRTSLNRSQIDSSVTRIPFVPEFSDEYSSSARNIHGTGETEPLIRPECSSALETGYESMSEINH